MVPPRFVSPRAPAVELGAYNLTKALETALPLVSLTVIVQGQFVLCF